MRIPGHASLVQCCPCLSCTLREAPGSGAAQRKPSSRAAAGAAPAAEAAPAEEIWAPLNVGFAEIELRRPLSILGPLVSREPELELHALARDSPWDAKGILALRDLIDHMLGRQWAADAGFVLTYDLRDVGLLQLEVIDDIFSWVAEPSRWAVWRRRCICCRVLLPEDGYVHMVRAMLVGMSYVCPPACDIYLVTSASAPLQPGDLISKASDAPARSPEPPTSDAGAAASAAGASSSSGRAEAPAAAGRHQFPFGALEVGRPSSGIAYIRILACDGEIIAEDLDQMLQLIDTFARSDEAADGFSITYDLRALRTPSTSLIMRLAEWGGEPDRKELWEQRNKVNKVVITSGLRFSLVKGMLSGFLALCPPVCTTYLLTDPDEPETDACVWRV